MISGLPSVTHTHLCPPLAARNKATGLCGRSAGCHISPHHLKKSPPCPSRLCPEQLYCHPTHRKQRWVSKRGDFRHREVSQKQTDAPALAGDNNPPPLKVKGTHRSPDSLGKKWLLQDKPESPALASIKIKFFSDLGVSDGPRTPSLNSGPDPRCSRRRTEARCPTSRMSLYTCRHVCTYTVIYRAAIVTFTNPLIGI